MAAAPRRSPPRLLQVKATQMLSPTLKRVTLHGDALSGFPDHSDGAHIKLMFPQPHQKIPVLPTLSENGIVWPADGERPIVRTYSVARYYADIGQLDVDFVIHEAPGPGSDWARSARPGDTVGLAGPGGPDRVKSGADWYLLVADPSAFAALAAALANLPDDARGHALLEVANQEEILDFQHPAGIELHWLIRGNMTPGESDCLIRTVSQIDWLPGIPSIMLAGENSQVVAIRDFALNQKKVPRHMIYAVPYWKDTFDEEAYHAERHRIMDEMDTPDSK